MRRGRPSLDGYFGEELVTMLGALRYPVTANTLQKSLEQYGGKSCSWHTVRKYLQRLCEESIVRRQVLPTERGRKPLLLYFLRVAGR